MKRLPPVIFVSLARLRQLKLLKSHAFSGVVAENVHDAESRDGPSRIVNLALVARFS